MGIIFQLCWSLVLTLYSASHVDHVLKDFVKKLKANWWKFLFLGIVDAEGIYLQNMALKYITIPVAQ